MSFHARLRPDGALTDGSDRPEQFKDDVRVARLWGPRETVTVCGDDCEADHTEGRCIVPHEALIVARDREAKVAAEMDRLRDSDLRARAESALVARGEIKALPVADSSAANANITEVAT